MLAKLLRHVQRQWMGALALFLVLAGGTAYAANTVFSSDIVDGQVRSVDIGNNQVYSADVRNDTLPAGGLTAADLRHGSVAGSEIADNSISSSKVLANSLNGSDITQASIGPTDLTEAAFGARAYGRVSALNALSRSENIDSVTNPSRWALLHRADDVDRPLDSGSARGFGLERRQHDRRCRRSLRRRVGERRTRMSRRNAGGEDLPLQRRLDRRRRRRRKYGRRQPGRCKRSVLIHGPVAIPLV